LRVSKEGVQLSDEDLIAAIAKHWKDAGNESARLGTIMHRSIELFFNEEEVSNETKEFNFHFSEFCKANAHLEPYRTEWMVYSEEDRICGSVDMVMRDRNTGDLCIIDWKRVKKMSTEGYGKKGSGPLEHLQDANFIHYSLQLNLYRYILETHYGIEIKGGLRLVVLHPLNPTYQVYDAWDYKEEVAAILKWRKQEITKNENRQRS